MKVLIYKTNPKIRITAPEIKSYREFYTLSDKDSHYLFKMEDWTLVEEEPEFEHRRKDTIYFLETAKTHYADTSELEKCIEWLKSLNSPVEEEPVKEEICSKCVYHKKDDGYCYNPNGGMKRRINENGVYECTAFWEREQEEPKRKQSPALKKIVDNMTEEKLAKTRAEMELEDAAKLEYYQHFDPDC